MNREHLCQLIFDALQAVAPEVQRGAIEVDQPLREQVDLDSMDWLNFLIALRDKTGVAVAESDYALLRSVDDLLDYVAAQRRPTPKM